MNTSLRFFATLAGLAVVLPDLIAQPLTLKVRKEDSHVGFSVTKWAVFKEEGRFRDFDGTILYDPADPAATQVRFSILAASIDSRNDSRDRALRSDEFFHVSKFPVLTFNSTRVKEIEPHVLAVEGDLTIRGITRRVTVPVKVLGINRTGRELGTLVGFESTFTINREDFDVGMGWHVISKDVIIQLLIGAGSGNVASR